MKLRCLTTLLGTGLFVGAITLFAGPGALSAFTTNGGSLGVTTSGNGFQRDFRVWNNAADAASNNNITTEAAFPGATGAVLAVWKGAAAWNSDNPNAGKNFDVDYQGEAGSAAGTNGNVVSWSSSGCGTALAFTETPVSNGWRIIFCDNLYSFADGPGDIAGSQYDIQSIMAHEYGHALGLSHTSLSNCSGTNAATMCSFLFSGDTHGRTIEPDDAAGLESIYGAIDSSKPEITSLGGSTNIGSTLIINGTDFDTNVSVKFSAHTGVNVGMIGVVAATSTGGGTQIAVTIPPEADTGNVLVWEPPNRLSNSFPITILPPQPVWTDLGGGTTGVNGTPVLEMSGPLTASSSITLDLQNAAPSALALIFLSFTSSPASFLGGTLHAFPIDELVIVATDGSGALNGSAFFPGAPGGSELYFQVGIDDPTVPIFSASLSNGEVGLVP